MVPDPAEPCLYHWICDDKFVILGAYVDDLLITGNDPSKILEIKIELKKLFKLSSLGEPEKFLGMQIERDFAKKTIVLHQSDFVKSIVEKYTFGKERKASTPILIADSSTAKEGELDNTTGYQKYSYREIIGKLQYLAAMTRPDLSYAVNILT